MCNDSYRIKTIRMQAQFMSNGTDKALKCFTRQLSISRWTNYDLSIRISNHSWLMIYPLQALSHKTFSYTYGLSFNPWLIFFRPGKGHIGMSHFPIQYYQKRLRLQPHTVLMAYYLYGITIVTKWRVTLIFDKQWLRQSQIDFQIYRLSTYRHSESWHKYNIRNMLKIIQRLFEGIKKICRS